MSDNSEVSKAIVYYKSDQGENKNIKCEAWPEKLSLASLVVHVFFDEGTVEAVATTDAECKLHNARSDAHLEQYPNMKPPEFATIDSPIGADLVIRPGSRETKVSLGGIDITQYVTSLHWGVTGDDLEDAVVLRIPVASVDAVVSADVYRHEEEMSNE